MGKAMLAFLPQDEFQRLLRQIKFERLTAKTIVDVAKFREHLTAIRRRQYAIVDEEQALGLRGVAAPVFDAANYPVAAVNVAVARPITVNELHQRLAPSVMAAASRISEILSATASRRRLGGES
jgi:IclR family pca regulon transcriptional regulator